MSRNILLYLKDILENMQDAEEFIKGLSYEQFARDKKTFNAVARSLEVVGEATKTSRMRSVTAIRLSPGRRWPGCEIR